MDVEWLESGDLPEGFSLITFSILDTLNEQLYSNVVYHNGENGAPGQLTKRLDHSYVLLVGNSYC